MISYMLIQNQSDLKIFSWMGQKSSGNRTATFLKQLHLKNNGVNKPNTLHNDNDSARVNGNLMILVMYSDKYYGQIMFLDS